MKTSIDLNGDLGEGVGHDASLIPFISSANISCGLHAGDEAGIRQTLMMCHQHGVSAGAHPSFDDRANFGRIEMHLSDDILTALIHRQLSRFKRWADDLGIPIRHVKPHGAMYNMAARDERMACVMADAIAAFDPSLILFGLSGSASIKAGRDAGLHVANEVFADRTYQANGALTPRTQANALIHDPDEAVRQVLQIVTEGCVTAVNGTRVPLEADTICIHGDGPNAVAIVKAVHAALAENGIQLAPPGRSRHPEA